MKTIFKKPVCFTAITTLCLIVVALFAAGGCDKSEDPPKTVNNVNFTPCQQVEVRNGSESDKVEVAFTDKGIQITHYDFVVTCDFTTVNVTHTFLNGVLNISQQGAPNQANCICHTDVSYAIDGISQNEVNVIFINGVQVCCYNENTLIGSKGLALYWNHQIFNEQGRGFIFEFYEIEHFENLYELIFDLQIDNNEKSIEISLIDKIDEGKCPYFPMPVIDEDPNTCTSKGRVYIPENRVSEGEYKFTVKTLSYTVHSEFVFTKEKATLNIPDNSYFSCAIKDVFVAPKNLLHGSIVFAGEQNKAFALDFIEDLRALGLKDTIVPQLIEVDEIGNPIIKSWPPNNYSVPFLLTMTSDFSTIFELAKAHFNKNSALNIYLYSTNGDQARANFERIEMWPAK